MPWVIGHSLLLNYLNIQLKFITLKKGCGRCYWTKNNFPYFHITFEAVEEKRITNIENSSDKYVSSKEVVQIAGKFEVSYNDKISGEFQKIFDQSTNNS